jgi:hypothetical protein
MQPVLRPEFAHAAVRQSPASEHRWRVGLHKLNTQYLRRRQRLTLLQYRSLSQFLLPLRLLKRPTTQYLVL